VTAAFVEAPFAVEVRLLGWVAVAGRDDAEEWTDLAPKTVELIAWMATHPGPQVAERIRDDLWPERPASAKTLNNHSSTARMRLGVGLDGNLLFPSANDDRYRLSPEVVTDIDRVERRFRWAVDAAPAVAVPVLREALDMARGRPFATRTGYEWAFADQLVFHAEQLVVDVAQRLGHLCLDGDDPSGALWATAGGLRARPGDESLYQLRMRAFAQQGNRTSVHRALEELRAFLVGAEPSEPTMALYQGLMGLRRA